MDGSTDQHRGSGRDQARVPDGLKTTGEKY